MNIRRTLVTAAIAVLAVVSVPTTVEAAKKEKCYSLQKSDVKGISFSREYGKVNVKWPDVYSFKNGGTLTIKASKGYTILYNYTSKTNNYKTLKTPTNKSKKIKSGKSKTFKVKSNSAFKVKVVKGKVTKASAKKAKTYYFKCNYKKANFMAQEYTSQSCVYDYVRAPRICVEPFTYDKVVINITKNGKTSTYTKKVVNDEAYDNLVSEKITGPTTITVTGYKMGKKLGTYTYKYDVKTYTPKKLHDYKLKGSYTDPQYCTWKFDVPYGDGYALAYTTDGSTPSLTNGTFISDLTRSCGSYVDMYNDSNALDISYIRYDKDGKTTFKAQLYKKVYYKTYNGAYKFAGYEPYGGVTAHTYTTFRRTLTEEYTATENFPNTTCFYDYKNEGNGVAEILFTCVNYKGYVKTYTLKSGERLSDHTKYGACVVLSVFYKVGDQFNESMPEKFEDVLYNDGTLQARNIVLTAEDFRKSLTDNPTRLTAVQTFNDLQSYIINKEGLCYPVYDETTDTYYPVWKTE